MNKIILFLFICLQMFNTAITAQWSEGYIVRFDHDTIVGKIMNQSDIMFMKQITFLDPAGIETTYLPSEIQAFYITGANRYFESREIYLDSLKEVIFLRCLIKGEMSLYVLRLPTYRFYIARGEDMVELINTKQQKEIDGRVYSSYKYEYIISLKKESLPSCPELLLEIDKVNFTEKSLVQIVEKYNHCTGLQVSNNYCSSNHSTQNDYTLFLSSTFIYPAYLLGTNFTFGGGFQYTVNWPELSKSIFYSTGVSLEYNQANLSENDDDDIYYLFLISVPVTIEYNFRAPKFKPYIFAGIEINCFIEKEKTVFDYYDIYPRIMVDFPLGAGIKKGKFDFNIQIGLSGIQAQIGYSIGGNFK